MAAFTGKSPDDCLLSNGHDHGIFDTCLTSRLPKFTFIQPSLDFHTTSGPLTVSTTLEAQYNISLGTNTVVPRETEDCSFQKIEEDIDKLFVESTNVFAIDELNYCSNNNNIPPNVSVIFDKTFATTDSKEVAGDKRRKNNNQVEYRACGIKSRMATAPIKPCGASAASAKEKSCKGKKITESASKQPAMEEAAKDFVLVRARRGQATDRHSIAERARREKIKKRMNYLQDLVPGCCKATGKTVILDEIINYVKSLQNQVEFLSMKLLAGSPRYGFNFEPGNHGLGYAAAGPTQEYGDGRTLQVTIPEEQLDIVFDPSMEAACCSFPKGSTGADECDPELQGLVHGQLRQQDVEHEMGHILGFSEHH